MSKLWLVALLIAGIIIFAVWPEPQRPEVKVVGVLISGDVRLAKLEGLKEGLRNFGYQEGKNLTFVVRNAQNDRARVLPLARELVAMKPDVIVAAGGLEAESAKRATMDLQVPVVFMGVTGAVETGLVESLLSSGNNLTGLDNTHAELSGKRLEILKRLLPETRRVLALHDPRIPQADFGLRTAREAAGKLGIELVVADVSNVEEIRESFNAYAGQPGAGHRADAQRVDGILLLPSFFLESAASEIQSLSYETGTPVMGFYETEADLGYFAAYGVSYRDQGYQTARLVAKVLRGQHPSGIPTEIPDRIQLVINESTVKALRLRVDPPAMGLADIVVGRIGKQGGKAP